jgi:hypothetical protein
MKAEGYICEACGRQLKTQDTICLHCDTILSEAAQNPPAWRTPRNNKICPHCKGCLKSKHSLPAHHWPMWAKLALPVLIMEKLPERFIPPPYDFMFEWLLLAVLICISALSGYRESRDKNSYIPDNNL